MKKNILLFYCFLATMAASLKAQEIRPMPADSAYGVVHISVCNLREEGKFTSGMSTQALLGMPVKASLLTGIQPEQQVLQKCYYKVTIIALNYYRAYLKNGKTEILKDFVLGEVLK